MYIHFLCFLFTKQKRFSKQVIGYEMQLICIYFSLIIPECLKVLFHLLCSTLFCSILFQTSTLLMMGYSFIKAHTLCMIMRHVLVFQTLIVMHSFLNQYLWYVFICILLCHMSVLCFYFKYLDFNENDVQFYTNTHITQMCCNAHCSENMLFYKWPNSSDPFPSNFIR